MLIEFPEITMCFCTPFQFRIGNGVIKGPIVVRVRRSRNVSAASYGDTLVVGDAIVYVDAKVVVWENETVIGPA